MRERTKKMEPQPQIVGQKLLIEILLKLPVKSLVRFKCVSKSWLSLISDPEFAKLHFNHALAPRTHKLLLLPQHLDQILSIDFNVSPLPQYQPIPCNKLGPNVKLLGSCRGFVLCREGYQNFSIFNPSTGACTQIPPPWIYLDMSDDRFDPFLFGFGYDPSTDDYLVTLVCYYGEDEDEDDDDDDDEEEEKVIRAQIYSVRANVWRELDGVDLSYLDASVGKEEIGLHFNRAIHWLDYDHHQRRPIIVAFDLVERAFSKIALPNDFDCDFDNCQLREIGGYLGICVASMDEVAGGIWVMQEYKLQLSWTSRNIVVPPHTDYLAPVCVTKTGDVIGIDYFTGLVRFNDRGEVLEHRRHYGDHPRECTISDEPMRCDVVMHTDSLLSLPLDG